MVSNGHESTVKDLLVTRAQAAQATKLSVKSIDRAILAGLLRTRRIGRRVLISPDSLLEFCQCNHVIPARPPQYHREQVRVLRKTINDYHREGIVL